jgi:peptidyl-dipeptidase Dcp
MENGPVAKLLGSLLLVMIAGVAPVGHAAETSPPMRENPFFTESTLPFGLPPFDKITDADYEPAFDRALAEETQEVNAIAANPDKPTFENTIVALEKSGQLRERVERVFENMNNVIADDELQRIDTAMSPKLSAQDDSIHFNAALFARIDALFNARSTLGLDPESLRLLELYHKDFVRAGALLSGADKTRMAAINAELASRQTDFTHRLLADVNASAVVVDDKADLAGMAPEQVAIAAAAAKARKLEGKYVITLANTTVQDPLNYLQNRDLRKRIMEASLNRGIHGGRNDNRDNVLAIARLRAEQAALLGYPNFSSYVVDNQTAHTPKAVDDLLARIAKGSVPAAAKDAADMQAVIDAEHGGFALQSWDWQYYAEKVRKARFNIDESLLMPYFELDHVLKDGVFFAANKLYGLTFKERHDLPVYEPTVRVFEVADRDGKPLGLLLEDFYARPTKQGGAWMNHYTVPCSLLGTQPVVGNHHNIPRPAPGAPTLLTFDQVVGLFHEFGHGLHGLLTRVKYPYFSGTNVPTDFVEYPSQTNEMWAVYPEVLRNYAKHYKTGEPIPEALLNKLIESQKFGEGHDTTAVMEVTMLDQAWHELKPQEIPGDVVAFEAASLKARGVDYPLVPPRYRSAYFDHSFSGNYAGNYYAYTWADVLVADSIEWFKAHGGLTRENGDRYRSSVLSRGNSRDVMDSFLEFNGGPPDADALLRRRGLE